ncbi:MULTISPECIES: histone H1-like repetitive region-containing protein [Enterobacteriaceae]|uniref:histone H1-like repetitive region-containing protein n=1 Tax=Enterobacteriaceae TaxID=543 RepID=UPI001916D58F|nr:MULTISPECIES: histone H1-like repetitive region-containing protein [Enterobacteriaceae]EKY3945866.1 histone H1-like repetitive region-containing protein [Enterobacter hormaechei]HDU3837819.1 histone H1-like repetitive region-containing protein [Klebsiella pneumoniae subsp. pneumoniae]HDY0643778.1 histone H1-like repetitive region-containing protein [Escherichia coli]HED2254073.1 histone H1-like repetitive region-containing protein [Citrobacter freundii]MBK6269718.1 histone H1-like repetitiv
MTEKRGTGTEYGQDKLKDRADNYDLAADEKKPRSKLKLLGVLIVAIIGVGALYPVVFGGSKTPAEKTEEVIALNSDGLSVVENVTTNQKDAADKAAADKAAADKAAADKAAADKAAADKAAADKAAADKAAADKAAADKAAADKAAADKAAADKAAADKAAADKTDSYTDAEHRLLDNAAPLNPTTEIVSAEKVQEHATGQLPPEDVKGIADAVIHDPTVKATDEAKKVSQNGTEIQQFDAGKFGIGADSSSAVIQQPRSNQHLQPIQKVVEDTEQSSGLNSDDILKSYTGQSSEVSYHSQSQNTVYVYGSFAAKVYLLPLGKNEKINAYLSDPKGWEVSQLPGDILRIKRSINKSEWSDATDLFLVAGKRTYTLILQGVDQPKLRTDSLRYIDPKALPAAKSGKK